MAKDRDEGTGADVTEFSKEDVVRAVDQKWIDALSAVSRRVETAGSGHVEIYHVGGDLYSVDAEATLRHFLEVTCNVRVQPDHGGHKVPSGTHAEPVKTGGVAGVNDPRPEAKPNGGARERARSAR